jgi:nucleotide-binding universal stress UspA family protein
VKILLGIDGSKYSEAALNAVATQFRPQGSEVRVVHVVQPIYVGAPPPQMAPNYAPEVEGQVKQGEELVKQAKKKLQDAGFKAETAVATGDIREKLIDIAAEWQADLIVVGSHGYSGIRRFLLGSVAEFVARNALCSVEIVRIRERK